MTYDDMITVLEAARKGRKIESRWKGCPEWVVNHAPQFNFEGCEYRIAKRDLGGRFWFWRASDGSNIHVLGPDGNLKGALFIGVRLNDGQISADGITWEQYV